MRLEQTDAAWLDAQYEYSLADLEQCSGLSEAELRELVDYGALSPDDPLGAQWTFSGDFLVTAQAAGRLRADLELEPQALALVLTLIKRIRELEAQIGNLRAQLPRRAP
ncbi:MAG: chaperone modulator CbpM [Pseudomonadota bacterium]